MNLLPSLRARVPFVGVMAALLGLAASPVPAAGAGPEEFVKTFTISNRAEVRVNTNDGGVRITTSDTKEVGVRVTYQGYVLDKDLRIDAHQDGDKVEVTARLANNWGFHWAGMTAGYRLRCGCRRMGI